MKMKRLLITGAAGFLGGRVALKAFPRWKTHLAWRSSPVDESGAETAFRLDVTDGEAVHAAIREIAPHVVVHAAALTDSNFCAENRETAWEVNVKGSENMARAAEAVGARLIYLSTDLVFDGKRRFYTEEDAPDPVCFYGKTKWEGEKAVSSACSNVCIARSALIYGFSATSARCFTEVMIESLKRGRDLTLFTDEFRTPVYIENICDMLLELAEMEDARGVFHIAGPERRSRFDFGRELVDAFGFGREHLIPVSVDDFAFKDPRPRDCSMKSIRSFLKTTSWSPGRGLREMKKIDDG